MKYIAIVIAALWFYPVALPASSCENGLVLYGKISDSQTHIGVSGVTVSTAGDDACESAFTDNDGRFKLRLSPKIKSGQSIRIRAEKLGYDVFDQWEPVSDLPLEITISPKRPNGKERSGTRIEPVPPNKIIVSPHEVLALSNEIDAWVKPKYQEREDYQMADNPNHEGPDTLDRLERRRQYDERTRDEFVAKFSQSLSDMVNKLNRCNADTKDLQDSIGTATRVEHFRSVAWQLKKVAHEIPEGQPACGTGNPITGFRERDKDMYMLLYGSSSEGFYKEDLELGRGNTGGFNDARSKFSLYMRDGMLCVDAKIDGLRGGLFPPLVEVVCNRVTPAPGLDVNYNDKAVEVVDPNQIPIFQIIFETPKKVRINTAYLDKNGEIVVVSGPEVTRINPSNPPPVFPLKTLFKYPSWKYLGKYADEPSANGAATSAPHSRILTLEQADKFRNALAKFPHGSLGVLKASTSDDALPLEAQLTEQANKAGWNILKVGAIYTSAGPPVADGLECYLRDGWNTAMGLAFQSAMNAAGLECKYVPTSYSLGGVLVYDGAVTLLIGRNLGTSKD
jgi:hypothetical protein